MKKGYLLTAVIALAALAFILTTGFTSCTNPQPQQGGDAQSLVMTACTACHNSQRVCDALGKKDRDGWNETVNRMVGKGAKVPSESLPLVVDYLAGLQPGAKPVCK